MFHAERYKYAPLKGSQLILLSDRTALIKELELLSRELDFNFSPIERLGDRKSFAEDSFHQVNLVIDADKVDPELQRQIKKTSQVLSSILILSGKNDEGDLKTDWPILNIEDLDSKEAAIRILDKVLSNYNQELAVGDEMELVDFNYLRQTFQGQQARYQQLIDMMISEFEEARTVIGDSLEKSDVTTFRAFKHKLQPSANYLQLTDLINVMEAIKQNFDQLGEKRNEHLAPKMMKYFDSILEALEEEKTQSN